MIFLALRYFWETSRRIFDNDALLISLIMAHLFFMINYVASVSFSLCALPSWEHSLHYAFFFRQFEEGFWRNLSSPLVSIYNAKLAYDMLLVLKLTHCRFIKYWSFQFLLVEVATLHVQAVINSFIHEPLDFNNLGEY